MSKTVTWDGHEIEISNPDKVLFPGKGNTKQDLVDYYGKIAAIMLPYLKDRPVSMHRFPDGIDGKDFYQKDIPDYFPAWISQATVEKNQGGSVTHAMCNNTADLVYLANQACVVPHIWLSRRDQPRSPDRLIFDLDPSADDFDAVKEGARLLRDRIRDRGLTPFVMTTGSRGLHVVVPLRRGRDFDAVREFARQVAKSIVEARPDSFTLEPYKNQRGDRVFIDTNRNAYAQTGVPPYGVRAREGAPVATPLDWEELNRGDLQPDRYTIRSIFKRLSKKEDPWKGIDNHAAELPGKEDRPRTKED